MAGNISGYNKFDLVLGPTTITTTLTSNYVDMSKYDKVIFIGQAGTMTSTEGMEMSLLQAKSSTGSGSAALLMYSTINGTPGILGQVTKVTECVLAGSSEAFGHPDSTIVINGLTYTFKSSSQSAAPYGSTATFNANRYVKTTTGDASLHSSEPFTAINHFAAYVNHAQFGVPGVVAVIDSNTSSITLRANDHIGEASITCIPIISSTRGATGIYITKAIGTMEVHSAQLATSSDFNFVALQSSANGAAVVHYSVAAVRSGARFSPDTTALYQYNLGTT